MTTIRRHASILVIVALVPVTFAVTAVLVDGFLSGYSVRALLVLAAILGLASVGQTLTVVVGGIDLSIPAVIAMANVTLATLYGDGWPSWRILILVSAVAVVIGAVNGLLSYALAAPSLVVTLATGSIVTGVTLVMSQGGTGGSVPPWVVDSVSLRSSTLGLPLPPIVVAWILVAVAVVIFERRTVAARRMYATGMNPLAARLALIRVPLVWAGAFAASAFFAAVAGIALGGFSGGANVTVGAPYLFLTIAAVVVGGTSLLGGNGTYARTVVGAILMVELSSLLLGLGYGTEMQLICLGGLIVLLVALYGRTPHVSHRI